MTAPTIPERQRAVIAKLQALIQEAYAAQLPITAAGLQRAVEAVGWESAGDKEQAHRAQKRGR